MKKNKNQISDIPSAVLLLLLSTVPIFILVFVEHDEFFILFLIEMGFLVILGLFTAVLTISALWVTDKIQEVIGKFVDSKNREDLK